MGRWGDENKDFGTNAKSFPPAPCTPAPCLPAPLLFHFHPQPNYPAKAHSRLSQCDRVFLISGLWYIDLANLLAAIVHEAV